MGVGWLVPSVGQIASRAWQMLRIISLCPKYTARSIGCHQNRGKGRFSPLSKSGSLLPGTPTNLFKKSLGQVYLESSDAVLKSCFPALSQSAGQEWSCCPPAGSSGRRSQTCRTRCLARLLRASPPSGGGPPAREWRGAVGTVAAGTVAAGTVACSLPSSSIACAALSSHAPVGAWSQRRCPVTGLGSEDKRESPGHRWRRERRSVQQVSCCRGAHGGSVGHPRVLPMGLRLPPTQGG